MADPREILYRQLLRVGIGETEARLIAIDAGGQGIIDKFYLSSLGIKKNVLQNEVLLLVYRLEIGDLV